MYPCGKGVQLTRAPGHGAWGVSFSRYVIRVPVRYTRKGSPPMAEQLLEEGAFEGWEEDLPDVIVEEIPEELTK